jgi:hypothetical protein
MRHFNLIAERSSLAGLSCHFELQREILDPSDGLRDYDTVSLWEIVRAENCQTSRQAQQPRGIAAQDFFFVFHRQSFDSIDR